MGVIVPSRLVPHEHPPSPLTRSEGGRWGLNQDCNDRGMMGVIPSRPSSVDSRLRVNDVKHPPLTSLREGEIPRCARNDIGAARNDMVRAKGISKVYD